MALPDDLDTPLPGDGDPPSSSSSSSSSSSATGEGHLVSAHQNCSHRLFNGQPSIHQVLGGGKTADLLLWREKYISAAILAAASLAWLLLEHSGYSFLSIFSNVLLLLILGLFAWANAAVFVHKDPPRIPELQVSEDMVVSFASALRVEINKALEVAHDIALGKDLHLFLKVVAGLWALSLVGGLFSFLTLLYTCIVVSHIIPVIYEMYEEQIDSFGKEAMDEAMKYYKTIGDFLVKLISKVPSEKKIQ